MASVIITTRNEPDLKWTVDNVRRTSSPDEIIVIYDGKQKVDRFAGATHIEAPWTTAQGVGKCRHLGAMLAGHEDIVWLDAHMDFENGWLEKMQEVCTDKSVVCSRSIPITRKGMRSGNGLNAGAIINYHGFGKYMPLQVEWVEPFDPGQIQCCLGACYLMKNNRYREIGKPFENCFGWGTSEPILCMVNEFCGGVNLLADVNTGHIYRQRDALPYEFGTEHKIGRIFNRLRLLRLLPIPEQEFMKLWRKTITNKTLRMYADRAKELLNVTDDSYISALMTLSWSDYCAKWWPDKDKPKQIPQIQPQPQQDPRDRRFL